MSSYCNYFYLFVDHCEYTNVSDYRVSVDPFIDFCFSKMSHVIHGCERDRPRTDHSSLLLIECQYRSDLSAFTNKNSECEHSGRSRLGCRQKIHNYFRFLPTEYNKQSFYANIKS